MLACRLIVDPPAAGAWNMAVDEALLDTAADKAAATLRFYQWAPATLSLGYFQELSDRSQHTESAACPVVRRHSGGGAILHDRELTYSLALPANALPDRDPSTLYRTVHQVLLGLLSEQAPRETATMELCAGATSRQGLEPFLCFQRRATGDLLVRSAAPDLPATVDGAHKIGGSSQRKRRGAVLQHGSLLLEKSLWAPQLPGFAELTGVEITQANVVQGLSSRLSDALALAIQPGCLSESESCRANQLVEEKFAQEEWIGKR